MSVKDTSLEALEKYKEQLKGDAQKVFEILLELGPTHDRRILEALNQKEQKTLKPRYEKRKWEINSVTGRRNDLVGLGAIEDLGPHVGFWHGQKKTYHIWRVRGDNREPIGWKLKEIEARPQRKSRQQIEQHITEIQNKVAQPILQKLGAGTGTITGLLFQ